MRVEVELFSIGLRIGSATLESLDPPMGCASGAFSPSENYDPHRHALYRFGEYAEPEGLDRISVALSNGKPISCLGVTIYDARPDCDELEADVIGVDSDTFRDLFSSHPHYIDYFKD